MEQIVGVATVILAKQNPESYIYSFEPHLETYKLLEENVKKNNLTNVKIFNMGVSDNVKQELTLFNHPHYSGGNTTCCDDMSMDNYFNTNINKTTVKSMSLDEIICHNNIDNIELLKIDCEGAEYEIIYSSLLFKTGIVKNMVGEFHSLKYNTKSDNNVDKLMDYCNKYVNGFKKITLLTL